jgi:hypothetical protein
MGGWQRKIKDSRACCLLLADPDTHAVDTIAAH